MDELKAGKYVIKSAAGNYFSPSHAYKATFQANIDNAFLFDSIPNIVTWHVNHSWTFGTDSTIQRITYEDVTRLRAVPLVSWQSTPGSASTDPYVLVWDLGVLSGSGKEWTVDLNDALNKSTESELIDTVANIPWLRGAYKQIGRLVATRSRQMVLVHVK